MLLLVVDHRRIVSFAFYVGAVYVAGYISLSVFGIVAFIFV